MAKRKSGSSARGTAVKRKEKYIKDEDIDFSDIPELTDKELASMKRVGRPLLGLFPREMIAIRIDLAVLERIKKIAKLDDKGYQTLINEILSKYVTKISD